jgi:hypothetical protein
MTTRKQAKSEFVAIMSMCNSCKHNNRDGSCKAFDVIPDKFMFDEKHTMVIPGQLKPAVYTPVA